MIDDPRQSLLVAEVGGVLIGTVTTSALGGGRAYLGMLGVSPRLQAKGVGRALVAAAESEAAARFSAHMMEMTVIAKRTVLIAWYERLGYRLTGEQRPFPLDVPGRDELVQVVLERQLA